MRNNRKAKSKLNSKSKNIKKSDSVNKELEKRLNMASSEKSGAETVSLRNLSHKNSFGSSNWNNFMKMENSKMSLSPKTKHISTEQHQKVPLLKSSSFNENKHKFSIAKHGNRPAKVTKLIGMDCEMVGVGENGSQSVLARVSLVNSYGECIYDRYVKSMMPVTDYRTFVSGIRPHNLESGEDFFKVQNEVAAILKGKTLVGHALKHDLQVLILHHPRKFIRDTITFMKFRNEAKGSLSLKNLALQFLNVRIQEGEHDSIEDARVAMQLYITYRKEWEKERHEKWLSLKATRLNNISKPVTDVDI